MTSHKIVFFLYKAQDNIDKADDVPYFISSKIDLIK